MPTFAQTDLKFFATAADFRKWIEENHHQVADLWLAFY
jgi:hypothetical protein